MADACRRAGVLLAEVFAHRLHPQNVRIKRMIDEGRIGKVLGMTSIHSSGPPRPGDIKLDRALAGGALRDKGCYCINTARFITGEEPVSVSARVDYGETSGVDERVTALLEFPGGARVFFETSFRLAPGGYNQGFEIFGEQGRLRAPEGFVQLPTYRRAEIVNTAIYFTDHEGQTHQIDIPGAHQWKLQVEDFADRVAQGPPYGNSAEEGILNMNVLDAVFRSGREGRPVRLRDHA